MEKEFGEVLNAFWRDVLRKLAEDIDRQIMEMGRISPGDCTNAQLDRTNANTTAL